ncbi:unannotated protein [freshwater metagenome]|uniref:Probable nicotinate-nucleotide pyrophosphorylase [carboxylating] n=1 Tax=freshwater metagenome TaxID=449393 RepID=A0A6J6PUC3_9ZZZZ
MSATPEMHSVDVNGFDAAALAIVEHALTEDIGTGDITTDGAVPEFARCTAELVFEESGVVCGLALAAAVFERLDPDFSVEIVVPDGERVGATPAVIARLEGRARAVLTGERVALNLLGRLSGIATATRRYVDEVAGTGTTILDTRKTTPGLRLLERYAVACGGGTNHRSGLYDAVLIKENHIRIAGGVGSAIAAVRAAQPGMPVEVEVESEAELDEALAAGAERILLDNMTPERVEASVKRVDGRAWLEASGGITFDTVRTFAETGVDAISIGALTHSVRSLDVSLEVS